MVFPNAVQPNRRETTLLALTFVESFGTVLLERGLYFYTHERLLFGEVKNLGLALCFGVFYAGGALSSHRVALRMGERRALFWSLVALFALHAACAGAPHSALLVAAFPLIGFVQGLKWPLVESYISAGHTPNTTLGVLGRFNVSWALAVPLAVASSGPMIQMAPWMLFAVAALINVGALSALFRLDPRPVHLDDDHPERASPETLAAYGPLLRSSRWSMLESYALLFLLAPLLPSVFERLGLAVELATASASVLDVSRVATFIFLARFGGWRGRRVPLVLVALGLPLSFALSLFGGSLSLVLVGEVLFGIFSGVSYHAALYYALVIKRARVDAGGAHESLIGLGFALGPLVGLAGHALTPLFDSYAAGMLVSALPLTLVCTLFGVSRRGLLGERAEPATAHKSGTMTRE